MIKAILFDMDGILIDSERYYMEGTYHLMKSMGFEGTRQQVHSIIGTTMEVTYQMIYNLLEGKLSIEAIKKANDDYFNTHKVPYAEIAFDGVVEALATFKSDGLKMALCSSSPMVNIMECVKALNIETYFDIIVCGDDFKESKPNPEIYQFAMEHLGVTPEVSIVYEDSELGIMAGVNANVFTVARKEERFHLDQSKADLIVVDIFEFKNVVHQRMKG